MFCHQRIDRIIDILLFWKLRLHRFMTYSQERKRIGGHKVSAVDLHRLSHAYSILRSVCFLSFRKRVHGCFAHRQT